jgi:DNA polymerase
MLVCGDFETTYDQDYSLKKLSTAEYILDHRFETIMLSLRVDDGPREVHFGHNQVAARLSKIDWTKAAWLSHHTNFDGAILAWRYGHYPRLWLDTLSMARAVLHWTIGRSSLAAVSKYLGLPDKGDEVVRAMGKRLRDFSREELRDYALYSTRDNENCRLIFDTLRPLFNASELRLIDLTVRMFVQPQIVLNAHALAEHLGQVRADKAQVMARVAHIDPSVFSSQQKFAQLLIEKGVDVPTKLSPTTGQEIYALAKGDRGFKELCEDTSQPIEVQTLLAARLKTKSTIEETRTERMLDLALHSQRAPVPLKYYGARTGRLSGDDKYNWQNLQRGSKIRQAIEAPPGMRIVHRDSSQIEARMVAWLAGCSTLTAAFAAGRDVYSEFATSFYGYKVTKAETLERFVGKTAILGLGYGCGHERFRHMLFIGNGGVSVSVDDRTARQIVSKYRADYMEIPILWSRLYQILQDIIRVSEGEPRSFPSTPVLGESPTAPPVPITVGFESVWLPNNLAIAYPLLHEMGGDHWYKGANEGWVKIYGAKLLENISQALSRIIVTDIATRVFDATGYHPFLSTHDSLDYCVPEAAAEGWDKYLAGEFARVPSWAPGLPLASEGGFGTTLAQAEKGVNQ